MKIYVAERKVISRDKNIRINDMICIENDEEEPVEYTDCVTIQAESLEEAKKIAEENGIKYDDIFLHPCHEWRLNK